MLGSDHTQDVHNKIYSLNETYFVSILLVSEAKVHISPVSGQLLGGKLITIVGPCFEETDMDIKCRFGGKVVDGYVDGDNTKAYCVTQPQPKLGEYDFELSVDGGATYNYTAKYFAGIFCFIYNYVVYIKQTVKLLAQYCVPVVS